MAGAAQKRIAKELAELQRESLPNISAQPKGEDLFNWVATIAGPEGSPYEGAKFSLSIQFPSGYPFTAPKVSFVTPVFHPNVSTRGDICVDILKDQWSPALSISKVRATTAIRTQQL